MMLRDDKGRLLCCVCGTPVERHICAQDWKPIVDRAIDDHEQRLRDHERRLTALESERAVGDGCTCGVRPDVPRGPNHGAGCPMEVSEASMQLLRGMLSDAQEHRRSETQRAETAERELARLRAEIKRMGGVL